MDFKYHTIVKRQILIKFLYLRKWNHKYFSVIKVFVNKNILIATNDTGSKILTSYEHILLNLLISLLLYFLAQFLVIFSCTIFCWKIRQDYKRGTVNGQLHLFFPKGTSYMFDSNKLYYSFQIKTYKIFCSIIPSHIFWRTEINISLLLSDT